MNAKDFSVALSNVRDEYVTEALTYKTVRKKRGWIKWGTIAACVCLMVSVLSTPYVKNLLFGEETTVQEHTLSQPDKLIVQFIEMSGDHFKAVVVDSGENGIFPVNAELSVVFDSNTNILLEDGTTFSFNPDNPNTESILWTQGDLIIVEFIQYQDYLEENAFYNQLTATSVEIIKE